MSKKKDFDSWYINDWQHFLRKFCKLEERVEGLGKMAWATLGVMLTLAAAIIVKTILE